MRIKRKLKQYQLHRYIYEQVYEQIPEGLVVRHKCDNTRCINPEHLIIGTHADNVRDKVERGRSTFGERNPKAKLTEKQVLEIRNRVENNCKLGKEYGVSDSTISAIRLRKIWKYL